MCKWIDELGGRGCDFYGGESISHKVIEDIKADIEAARYGLINDGLDVALRIIDKHCPSCGAKMESEEISERNMKMWEEIFRAESEGKK